MKGLWSKYKKYRSLGAVERRAVLNALKNLIHISIALKVLSFERFKKYFSSFKEDRKSYSSETYVKAIKRASTVAPKSFTCLPVALVYRKALGGKLILGVQPSHKGNLDAHAWVEKDGEIKIGEVPDFEYLPLWVWE